MGLGKTVTTLSAINDLILDSFEVSRVLIIAPLRVAKFTWPEELKKWEHLKHLSFAVAVGSEYERRTAVESDKFITIINRENVCWLFDNYKNFRWNMLVIDELSSFKSQASKRFKALNRFRFMFDRVVGLTGTPAPNSLLDLWPQFKILDKGERLGRFITYYRTAFFRPAASNGHIVFDYKPLPGAAEAIYQRIADITVSMRAVEHLQMPSLSSCTTLVHMSQSEMRDYKKLKSDFVLSEDITALNAAALSSKLCQLANGAIYTNSSRVLKFHDHKLDALEDLIEAANGQPVLVAYWFKHDLTRIKARFSDSVELKKVSDFESWNAKKIPVALIHPASAGHGLNLQFGGHILIWFGLTWSLELYQQTNARLYRQGQKSSTVTIQHIVTADTIDFKIMQALHDKDFTQSRLIEAVKAELKE